MVEIEVLSKIIELLVSTVGALGYTGIFLLMAVESSFIPFPSEAVIIPAGVLAQRGELSAGLILLTAILGSLAGALINYAIGYFLGRRVVRSLVQRYGKFFLISENSFEQSEKYFRNHGEITTFAGRLVPMVRQLISIPAGFAKMNLAKFSFFSSLGAAFWIVILLALGILFGENQTIIQQNLTLATLIAFALALTIILIYLVFKARHKKHK